MERDAITGLRNRRGWESAMAQETTRCQRYGATASVLSLSLRPEAVGAADEQRLVRCADVLRRSCRPGDVPARVGARDVAVLALECDPVAARALLTRLRVQLRTAGLAASTGVATRRAGGRLDDAWVRAEGEGQREGRRRPVPPMRA